MADRFQIDRLIARGGMSTVYLAHQTKLNRPVALKVLSPPPSGDEAAAFEQRFHREAQTLAQLDHPNIVVLHDYGETEDDRFYLAMEYVDGPRLSDVLRDGPLPPQRALALLVQVCAGLRYAHKRGVVHRDLKPSNLLIRMGEDNREHVKIVDFGLVKLTETDQSITRAGLILGSPHCMAPEQVKGLEVDHRVDIYAVGVLLFRTLVGQYPFHGTNSAATMIAHLNQPIPTFYATAPEVEVPAGLEDVVRRCLAKHASERFADMRELIDALMPLMDAPPEGMRTMTQSYSIVRDARVSATNLPMPSPRTAIAMAFFGGAGLLALLSLAVALVVLGGLLQARWSRWPETASVGIEAPLPPPVIVPVPVPVIAALPAGTLLVEDDVEEVVEVVVEAVQPPKAPKPPPVAAKPTPKPAPKPLVAAPEPVVGEPATPAEVKPPKPVTTAPEGYLGLPDDLIE